MHHNSTSKNVKFIAIGLISFLFWHIETPHQLTDNAWHLFIIFVMTIVALISNFMPMGTIAFTSLVTCIITSAIDHKTALSGFSENIVWLVACAFFISNAVIKTGLGARIAYTLMAKFGHSKIGVSYSLLMTELIMAPMIPSATSRGGGIIYPIAKAVIESYSLQIHETSHKHKTTAINNIGKYFSMLCLHSNIITSSMFLTAMAGNPVAQSLAASCGVDVTWTNWATAVAVPGIISLLGLPFIVQLLYKLPPSLDGNIIKIYAKGAIAEMGKMKGSEIVTATTFIALIVLWIFEKQIGINSTTTAMLGVTILLLTHIITWHDIITSKTAWDTFIWFGILLVLANAMNNQGIISWIGNAIADILSGYNTSTSVIVICIGLFVVHYLFASTTVYFTAMYVIFLKMFIGFGINPLVAAYMLILVIMLSSGLTHYGIASAPVFFSGGYMSVKEWWQISGIISVINAFVWFVGCMVWWKMIDWI